MKIRPVEAESLHADRRTGMTKLVASFRNLGNVPKKLDKIWKYVHICEIRQCCAENARSLPKYIPHIRRCYNKSSRSGYLLSSAGCKGSICDPETYVFFLDK